MPSIDTSVKTSSSQELHVLSSPRMEETPGQSVPEPGRYRKDHRYQRDCVGTFRSVRRNRARLSRDSASKRHTGSPESESNPEGRPWHQCREIASHGRECPPVGVVVPVPMLLVALPYVSWSWSSSMSAFVLSFHHRGRRGCTSARKSV